MRSALIVDDDDRVCRSLARSLSNSFNVVAATTLNEARAVSRRQGFDVVVVDYWIASETCVDFVRELRADPRIGQIAVVSGFATLNVAVAVTKAGADFVFAKPLTGSELVRELGAAPADGAIPQVATLEELQREHIARVLGHCDGNVSLAAKLLGIHRTSVTRKLRSPK